MPTCKQLAKTLTLLALCLSPSLSNKEVEECVLEALSPSHPEYLFIQSNDVLDLVLRNYDLLPDTVKEQIKHCNIELSDERRRCEHKYGFENCVECGLILVAACSPGFSRVDCSTCARICPELTQIFAHGLLCSKPKILKRQIYRDYQLCLQEHDGCNKKSETLIISNCPDGFEELGDFLCAFECPEGFVDEDLFCRPETLENFDYTIDELASRID